MRRPSVPRNRRVAPSHAERLKARLGPWWRRALARIWELVVPRRLRRGVSWGMNLRLAGRTVGLAALVCWAVLTVIGFVRAWSLEGPYQDRARELGQVSTQLTEARARMVHLESQLDAIDRKPEVRMNVIRHELGMVRPNERVVRFSD